MAQGNAPRLRRREPRRYIGTDMLKIIGLLLTVQGTVGVALLQNGLLNMGGQTRLELWDLIQTDQNAAQVLAWSVLSKGMVSLAWPIFAYLAVEGLQNTSSFPRYALRLLITALVSEVPYDLAMSGKWVDWSSQNFLFSLLIGLVALYGLNELVYRLTRLVVSNQTNLNDTTISAQIQDAPHMTLLIVIFLAPFVEEVLFRGLVFGNLRRKSAAVGYLVSCLLFALLHVWQVAVVNRDITYFLLMLQYLVPGLVLAWVYDRTGTLWTSIGLHAAANALSAWTIVA